MSGEGFTAIQQLAATWAGHAPRFLFTSDLRRAQQSAQVFASHFAIEPLLDERLREIDFGDWEGLTWESIASHDGPRYRQWLDHPAEQCAPGGESFIEVLRRTGSWLSALLTSTSHDDTVLAVVHGGVQRALLCQSIGLPSSQAHSIAVRPAHASLIRCRPQQFEVCYLNATRFQTV